MDKVADFKQEGIIRFNPELSPLDRLSYEKRKFLEGILPKIKKLREKGKEKLDLEETFWHIINKKKNHRFITFENEKGEVYPKDIEYPEITYLQSPEPHVLVTNLYKNPKDWYYMNEFILRFAEEAFVSYQMGFFISAISCSINCCEYILKYEYLRYLNKKNILEADRLSNDVYFTMGSFLKNNNPYLRQLKIKTKFFNKINYLNLVRSSIYHSNSKKARSLKKRGKSFVERNSHPHDDLMIPIIAYNSYSIMLEIINHFYNLKRALEYLEEGKKDWMKLRKLKEKDLKRKSK